MKRVRHWWGQQSDQQRAILRYLLPLLAFAVVVGLDWLRLHHAGVATSGEARRLFTLIGVTIVVSVGIKLAWSRTWPLQELGHLGLLLGIAGLSLRLFADRGPQPVSEAERDLIQALLDTGAVALLFGMVLWVAFHGRRKEGGDRDPSAPGRPGDRSGAG